MKLTGIILIIFFSFNPLYGQNIWRTYSPQNTWAHFKVSAPLELHYTKDTLSFEFGEVYSERFYCTDEQGLSYMITFIEYPDTYLNTDSIEFMQEMVDLSILNIVDNLMGSLVYETDVSTVAYVAKLYRINYQNNSKTIKARVLGYHNQIYNIQVAAPIDESINPHIDKFLESFQLIE